MEANQAVAIEAAGLATHPASAHRPEQWGLLTAVSPVAKERIQGQEIVLYRKEHILGRLVPDLHYKFEPSNVSGKHCKIYVKTTKTEQGEDIAVFVQDSSSNGTFIQGERLVKGGPPKALHPGDILSIVGPPENEAAFAYVFRAVKATAPPLPSDQVGAPGAVRQPVPIRQPAPKRKLSPPASGLVGSLQPSEDKRARAGETAADNVVRLDDVKRLQRANEELRREKEALNRTIEALKAAARTVEQRHREESETAEKPWKAKLDQALAETRSVAAELLASRAAQAQQQSAVQDLQQRLAAAGQSRQEAEEAIQKHLATIDEKTRGLEEERQARALEKAHAAAEQSAATEKVRAEAAAELARKMDGAAREHEELARRVQSLQEADKDTRSQMESLRQSLEKERGQLVAAQEQSRRLQTLVEEERAGAAAIQPQLEAAGNALREQEAALETERAERVEAERRAQGLAAALEVKANGLARETERRKSLRERILVRETQLRAFHSTTAEAFPLLQKMMEQLVTMKMVSSLAPEDEQQYTRSGGELEPGSRGTNNPPGTRETVEGGEDDTGNSPLRRDEEVAEVMGSDRDVNMTQLEDDDDFVLSTAPVRRTPQKTPGQGLAVSFGVGSPVQRGSASKTPGLRTGLASPGGISRALQFGGAKEGAGYERREEANGRVGELEQGVFLKPADRERAGEAVREGNGELGEGEKDGDEMQADGKTGEESRKINDKERVGSEERPMDEREGEKRDDVATRESGHDDVSAKEGSEKVTDPEERDEGESQGDDDVGQDTLLMQDDVIGTVPATYAGGTLLMDEPEGGEFGSSLEGGFGTGKSTPLAQIPEEDVEEGEIRENGKVDEMEDLTQPEETATGEVGIPAEGNEEGEAIDQGEKAGKGTESQAGGSEKQPELTPESGHRRVRRVASSLENGQPPESFQLSDVPDSFPRGGSDAFARRVSFGGVPGEPNGRPSTGGGRRESLAEKVDHLMMDGDFTETEKGVQASPGGQNGLQPDSENVYAGADAVGSLHEHAKAGAKGEKRKNADRFWTGLDLNEAAQGDPPTSAPTGPRPLAGDRSPSGVKNLFRRKSSGYPGEAERGPSPKRFKGPDEEVVQDSGSERVSRQRGGSSGENGRDRDKIDGDVSKSDDSDGEDGPPGDPPRGSAAKAAFASSQRSVSGKRFENVPGSGPVRGSVGAQVGGEDRVEDGTPDAQQGLETQATGDDQPGRGSEHLPGRFLAEQPGGMGMGSAPLPSSLANLQCSEALTSARNAVEDESPVEPTPQAMPQPTVAPPAPKARTPRNVERTGNGRFDPEALAGLDVMLDIMRPGGESLQSDGRVGDSEYESEDEDLVEEDGNEGEEETAGVTDAAALQMDGCS